MQSNEVQLNIMKSNEISKKLMEDYNIYVQPIFYPTVPKDSSRLRITVTPKHTYQDIDYLIFAINETKLSSTV